jgi:hypothetical protein
VPTPALGISMTEPAENASGQVPLSAPGSVTLTASATGAGSGASYKWMLVSGSGSVASSTGPSDKYTSTAAGIASVSVTVTQGSASATTTIPIVTAVSSGSSTNGACSGLLGSIINQVFPGGASVPSGTAVLSAGPVTLDLPTPTLSGSGTVGSSGIGCTLPTGDTLNFSDATVTVGPLTLSNLSASVSLTQITLSSGTVTAPSSWGIGQGTISHAIEIPLDGTSAPTGAVTWTQSGASSGLPVLPAGTGVTGATTTVTLGASALTLTASANVLSGTVQASATIPLSGSASQPPCPLNSTTPSTPGSWCIAFSTTKDLQVLGTSVSGSGNFTYGANGFSGAFTATAGSTSQPIKAGPVNVTSATLTWNTSGISLSASAWALGTTAKPVINFSFAGSYQDSSNWSATVTGTVANNPQGLPSGVNLVNATVTGSVVDQGAATPTFDIKLSDPGSASQPALAISAGSAAKLSFTNLAVEISNGSPPAAACQAVKLPESAGDVWITLGGTASVTLGSAAPVSVSATACVDPNSGSFGLSATGFDNWSPGAGVTFTSLNLTVSYTSGAFQAVASGGLTVDGVQAQGAVGFTSDGNVIAIGALPNLSQLGLPLGNTAGVAVFSSDDIPDLGSPSSDSAADQAVLPEMFCGLSEGTWSGSACTGAQLPSLSEGNFAGVDANGLTLAASFSLPSSDTGLLNQGLGLTTPQDEITPDITVSVDLGAAVPTITGSLSAPGGGFTVLHVGPNTTKFPVQLGPLNPSNELPGSAFTLNLQSLDIQISLDGSLSVGAQATITMPSPTPTGASTNPQAPQSTSCADPGNKPINSSDDCEQLGLAAAITLDADGPTLTLAGTVDGCDVPGSTSLLCNALGVQGLDVGDLSVQLGLDFSTTPIPTPTFGFAAAIQTIPCNWASTIGYSEQGCSGSGGTPTVGLSPAMSIAVNLSDTGPIFAFQLGAPDSTTPILKFGDALTVDEASVVIAPAGGTIGAGPDAVTYQPGFSLSFNGSVMGVSLLVKASVDPTAGTISACANVGTISVGGLTISNASFDFALGASTTNQCASSSQLSSTQVNPAGGGGVGMVLGFAGSLSVGSTNATVALSMQATSGQYPMISLYASVGNIALLDNTVDLNSLVLSGSVEFNPDPPNGTPPFSFTVQGSASMSVLGNSINVAGSVALTSDGIQNFSLYANPSNTSITLGGADLASLTGNGCAPQQLPNSIPANIRNSSSGACVGVSYDPSAANSFQVTLDATAQVAGIAVSFDGTASNTGLNITNASASLPGIGSVTMSGQIWLGAGTLGAAGDGGNGSSASGTGNLAGTQWYDRDSGQWVNVQPGDFEFSLATQTPIDFDGVTLNTTLQFGSLGSDVFADGSAGLTLPGGGWVNLTGRFCASNGNFGFMLGASLDLNALDTYNLASGSATLTDGAACLGQFSGPTGLTFQVAFTPPRITDSSGNTLVGLTANAGGSVTQQPDGSFQYDLQGSASIDLYGVTLSGGFNWSNSTGSSVANLPFNVSQAFGSGIAFSGSAAVGPDGSVCGVSGSATIFGITGSATFCDSGGTPDIKVNFQDGDLAIGGSVDGPDWTLTASDSGSLSLDVSNSFLGITYAVDSSATWDISAILTVTGDNITLATPNVSGSGNLNASISIPALPTASSSASFSLSGTPADICGSAAMSASFIVTENVGSVEVCDNNGTVEVENLSWLGQTLPTPPFPSFPWTA